MVKGQGHQAALLSTALTRKAAAVVSVGTYSAWENTATLRLLGGTRRGEERGGAYYVATRTARYFCSFSRVISTCIVSLHAVVCTFLVMIG